MSRKIEEQRVVEMQFDNKQFEANCQTTLRSIEQLNKTLESTNSTKAFSQLQNGINKIDLSSISNGVDALVDKFSLVGMTGVKILDEISDKAIQVGKNLWNNTIGQIKSGGKQRALNIANAQFKLKGLGIEWADIVKDIDYGVQDTAYGLDAAANAAAQFSASGVALGDDMKAALRAISGVAAMTNSSYEEIANVFTAAAGKGRVQALELNRISLRGINAAAALAKELNVTESEIRDMAAKGTIDFNTFARAMDNAFGEHAKKANDTYVGSLSNLRAALSRIGEIFYTPILDSQIQVNNKLKESIDNIKNAMKPASEGAEAFSTKFDRMAHLISDISTMLIDRFSPSVEAVREKLQPLNNAMDKVNVFLSDFKSYVSGLPRVTKGATKEASSLADEVERITAADKKIALDIWNFSDPYGNGQQRIDMLGDSYDRVQKYINTFISTGYDVAKTDEILGLSASDAADSQETLNQALAKGKDSFKLTMFNRLAMIFSNIATAASNITTTVVGTVKALFSAFGDVFSIGQASNDLVNLSETLVKFTEAIKPTEKTLENLKRTFRGIIAVFDIFYQAIRAVFNGVLKLLSPLIGGIDKFGGNIFEVTGTLGDFIFAIDNAIKKGDIFGKAVDKIIEVIKNLPSYVKIAVTAIKSFVSNGIDKLSDLTGIDFKGIFGTIAESVKGAAKAFLEWSGIDIHGIIDGIKSWAKELWAAIKSGDYKKALEMLWGGIKGTFTAIGNGFKELGTNIKNAVMGSSIGEPIRRFIDILEKLKDKVVNILGSIFGKNNKAMKHASGKRGTKLGANSAAGQAIENEISVLDALKETLSDIWGAIKSIFGGIINFLTGNSKVSLWSILSDFLGNIQGVLEQAGFESLKDIFIWLELDKLLDVFKLFGETANKVSKSLSGFFSSLSGLVKQEQKAISVRAFKNICTSLVMIVVAIIALATAIKFMPAETAFAIGFVSTILLMLVACFKIIMESMAEVKSFMGVGAAFRSLGVAMILIVAAIGLLAIEMKKIDDPQAMIVGFLGVLAILGLMTYVLKELAGFGTAGEYSARALSKAGKTMKTMAWAILMLVGCIYIVGNMDDVDAAQGWGIVISLVGMMILIIKALDSLSQTSMLAVDNRVTKTILAVGACMVALGTALTLMMPAIVAIGMLPPGSAAKGVAALVVMLGTIFGALIGLNKLEGTSPKKLMAAAGAIAIIAWSMAGLIAPIAALGYLDSEKLAMGVLMVVGGLSAIVLAIIGVTQGSAGGASSMMAAAGAIAIITIALQGLAPVLLALGSLDFDVMAQGMLAIAGFLAILFLMSKFMNPVAVIALGASILLLGLGVLFLADAMMTAVQAIILAAACWKLIEGMGSKVGKEVGRAIVAISNEILDNAFTVSAAISVVLTEVLTTLFYSLIAWVPAAAAALVQFFIEVLKILDENMLDIATMLGEIGSKAAIGLVTGFVNGFYEALLGASKDEMKEAWKMWTEDIVGFFNSNKYDNITDALKDSQATSQKELDKFTDDLLSKHDDNIQKGIDIRTKKQRDLKKKYGESWEELATKQELEDARYTEYQLNWMDEQNRKEKVKLYENSKQYDKTFDDNTALMEAAAKDYEDAGVMDGEAYTNGVVKGIKNKKKDAEKAAKDAGNTIRNAFQVVLRIASPSKVMEKNGEYTVQGLIDGMTGMEDELDAAGTDLGENVKSSLTDSLDDGFSDFSISDSFSDAFDDESLTITPVWDDSELLKGTDDITSMLNGTTIGGLDSSGFDLSSILDSDGNLSFDMANMDSFLSKLNLEEYFGNLNLSTDNLTDAVNNLSGNIFDMNNKESIINLNLDGYQIANSTSSYSDSINGDREAMVNRGIAITRRNMSSGMMGFAVSGAQSLMGSTSFIQKQFKR